MIWTIPNMLTMARIAAAPLLAVVFVVFDRPAADWAAFWLFAIAAATDFLDGWLARRLDQTSAVGAMLDPIADKAMVMIGLTVVMWTHPAAPMLALPVAVIVLREVLVSGLREYLGEVKLPVTRLAKWKTTAQLVGTGAVLLSSAWTAIPLLSGIGVAVLWIAAILTAVTGWDYVRRGVHHIVEREAP